MASAARQRRDQDQTIASDRPASDRAALDRAAVDRPAFERSALDRGAIADRLDRPPPAGAQAPLPAEFGRRFAIFADAEEEFDWARPFDRSATAVTAIAALPAANRRLRERGIVPTYLVDYAVVDTPASAAVIAGMAAAGECDVGAQLHPWVTPPHEEEVSNANSFAGNLPAALEAAKLAALTRAIIARTGVAPAAYRAGRYGVGPGTAANLVAAGYRLDVSARALFDYRASGGVDFSRHPVTPWWLAGDLLAVPLTAARIGPLRRLPLPRAALLRGTLARTRLASRIALTPEGMPLADAKRAVETLLADGQRLFSLSFHTPSVVPGHTPYVRDAADLRLFWAWWDGILDLFARRGVTPVRAGEIVAAADAARLASPPPQPLSPVTGPVAQG